MTKKNIFINLGEDIVARNIFTKDFWNEFLLNTPYQVVLLVQEGKKDFFEGQVPEGLVIEEYKRGRVSRKESLLNSLARSGIDSHTNLWSKMRSYKRGDSSFFDTMWKRFLATTMGNFDWYKKIIRKLLLTVSPDEKLNSLFNTYNPVALFATSLSNYDFDVPISREAKRRGIKLIGMGRSWDNFSSHGLLRVVPDVFLIQNQFLVDMAEEYQAIYQKEVSMKVVGLPHYDAVAHLENILEPREKFLNRLGLSSNDKYVLYGAMGEFLFIHEGELPQVFDSLMEEKKINVDKVIYRAHPKFKITPPTEGYKHVVFDTSGEYVKNSNKGIDDNAYLINSIFHSEVLITGASTMAIDGAVLDKPIVCVAFNGTTKEQDVDYYESVKRFYDLYTHFEDLMSMQGVKIAYNKEELVKQVNQYLENPSLDKEGRRRIRDRFAYKIDGLSGKRIADELNKELQNL